MPDRFVFDLRQPYPGDVITETFRQAVVAAIDDLAAAVAEQQIHADQLDGALLLCTTAFDFAETMLSAVLPMQQALQQQAGLITTLQTALGALTDRVTALENPPAPALNPTTGGAA